MQAAGPPPPGPPHACCGYPRVCRLHPLLLRFLSAPPAPHPTGTTASSRPQDPQVLGTQGEELPGILRWVRARLRPGGGHRIAAEGFPEQEEIPMPGGCAGRQCVGRSCAQLRVQALNRIPPQNGGMHPLWIAHTSLLAEVSRTVSHMPAEVMQDAWGQEQT